MEAVKPGTPGPRRAAAAAPFPEPARDPQLTRAYGAALLALDG